jgi:two-component system sensor histidine kinase KdpD
VDLGQDSADEEQKSLAANLQFAESLGAKTERLKGESVAGATAAFVREKHVTQVIFGRSAVEGWRKYLYMTAIHRFLRDAPAVDVHIVTQEPD